MHTTLTKIKKIGGKKRFFKPLMAACGKEKTDNEPLGFLTILDYMGVEIAIYCMRSAPEYNDQWQKFAIMCAGDNEFLLKMANSKTFRPEYAEECANINGNRLVQHYFLRIFFEENK